MTFSASWYTQHPSEEKTPQSLDVSHDKITAACAGAGKTTAELKAEAITRADGFSFQVANPWFKRTDSNLKLVNHWLQSKHITYPQYADFAEAADTLAKAGLLSVDEVLYVQHLDGNDATKFTGHLTKREYNNLDSLIAQEREAALKTPIVDQSDIFDGHDIEEVQARLRQAERDERILANVPEIDKTADAWFSLHPEITKSERNAQLLSMQLRANGVPVGIATSEQLEVAASQLVEAGLLRLNKVALEKQQKQEVLDRAQHTVKNSAAFDKTTESEMYELPLDEVRRRANGNYSGIGF